MGCFSIGGLVYTPRKSLQTKSASPYLQPQSCALSSLRLASQFTLWFSLSVSSFSCFLSTIQVREGQGC